MLSQDSEDEIQSRFVFELAIWLWQDELNPKVRCAFGNVSSGRVRISSIQNFSLCNNRGLLNIKVLKVQNQLPKDNKTRRIGSLSINLFLQEMDLWQLHRWADSQRECYFRKCTRAGGIRGLGKAQSHLFPQVLQQQVSYCKVLPYKIHIHQFKISNPINETN